ncbi:MAG: dynamin family protein [Pseudomonadales bacterium]|jgi:hypothetical protein|nr:dynamin family protein [Pseudomonadales bacterium]
MAGGMVDLSVSGEHTVSDATTTRQNERLKRLRDHLERENPILAETVDSFRSLDEVARRLGFLEANDSFTSRVSWWPVIAILGTFSAGKSTFINSFIGQRIQSTGNQAVDDKFTVICYGAQPEPRVLPGLALDSDPRFPFYRISRDIEAVAAGEGRRLDSYLQLKTCNSERLKGRILLDSPGFDADAQRTSTLHVIGHIIDLADLALVFFDARHPEPGAMQDTLDHLVAETIRRPDANKFLYVLNQIDLAAREDNPEEVFGAWQRSLAQKGLTAGKFYRIYDKDAAVPLGDGEVRRRFEAKRDEDMAAILRRIEEVDVERAYRIIGVLEKSVKRVRDDLLPRLTAARARWRRRVFWLDGILAVLLVGLPFVWSLSSGAWEQWAPLSALGDRPIAATLVVIGLALLAFGVHMSVRRLAASTVLFGLGRGERDEDRIWLLRAFRFNASPWRSLLPRRPVNWNRRADRELDQILADADGLVQRLNDRFANPSGETPSLSVAAAPNPAPATDGGSASEGGAAA